MTITEEHVSQLASMGFSATQAREALTITSGNLEHAVNFLLGGGNIAARAGDLDSKQPASNEDDSASNDSVAAKAGGILRAPISQYSVEHGRSACTCIVRYSYLNLEKYGE